MSRRTTTEYRCTVCHAPIRLDNYVRGNAWAFGIKGVRWAVCSPECARIVAEREREAVDATAEAVV